MAGIEALTRRIEKAAAREVLSRVASSLAPVVQGEILRGFNEQRDPYGSAWASRKDKRGSWPILDRQTSRSAVLSLRTTSSARGLRSTIKYYMRFHQSGTKYMVARKIFAEESRGFGLWRAPVAASVSNTLRGLIA